MHWLRILAVLCFGLLLTACIPKTFKSDKAFVTSWGQTQPFGSGKYILIQEEDGTLETSRVLTHQGSKNYTLSSIEHWASTNDGIPEGADEAIAQLGSNTFMKFASIEIGGLSGGRNAYILQSPNIFSNDGLRIEGYEYGLVLVGKDGTLAFLEEKSFDEAEIGDGSNVSSWKDLRSKLIRYMNSHVLESGARPVSPEWIYTSVSKAKIESLVRQLRKRKEAK